MNSAKHLDIVMYRIKAEIGTPFTAHYPDGKEASVTVDKINDETITFSDGNTIMRATGLIQGNRYNQTHYT